LANPGGERTLVGWATASAIPGGTLVGGAARTVWELQGSEPRRLDLGEWGGTVTISSDRAGSGGSPTCILLGSEDGNARLAPWDDRQDKRSYRELSTTGTGGVRATLSADGRLAAATNVRLRPSDKGRLTLWSIEAPSCKESEVGAIPLGQGEQVEDLGIVKGHDSLAYLVVALVKIGGRSEREVRGWRVTTGSDAGAAVLRLASPEPESLVSTSKTPTSIAVSPQGDQIAVGTGAGTVSAWTDDHAVLRRYALWAAEAPGMGWISQLAWVGQDVVVAAAPDGRLAFLESPRSEHGVLCRLARGALIENRQALEERAQEAGVASVEVCPP
jgi:WD40 repeat protein